MKGALKVSGEVRWEVASAERATFLYDVRVHLPPSVGRQVRHTASIACLHSCRAVGCDSGW